MVVIRAHFDGSVIVPDEPIHLEPQAQVVVLVDSLIPDTTIQLEQSTRQYYEGLNSDDPEDQAWGTGVARDSHQAWGQE